MGGGHDASPIREEEAAHLHELFVLRACVGTSVALYRSRELSQTTDAWRTRTMRHADTLARQRTTSGDHTENGFGYEIGVQTRREHQEAQLAPAD